eukprot:scaffold3981_cov302-Prasinococcus_capsulatus_cf.AAC.4
MRSGCGRAVNAHRFGGDKLHHGPGSAPCGTVHGGTRRGRWRTSHGKSLAARRRWLRGAAWETFGRRRGAQQAEQTRLDPSARRSAGRQSSRAPPGPRGSMAASTMGAWVASERASERASRRGEGGADVEGAIDMCGGGRRLPEKSIDASTPWRAQSTARAGSRANSLAPPRRPMGRGARRIANCEPGGRPRTALRRAALPSSGGGRQKLYARRRGAHACTHFHILLTTARRPSARRARSLEQRELDRAAARRYPTATGGPRKRRKGPQTGPGGGERRPRGPFSGSGAGAGGLPRVRSVARSTLRPAGVNASPLNGCGPERAPRGPRATGPPGGAKTAQKGPFLGLPGRDSGAQPGLRRPLASAGASCAVRRGAACASRGRQFQRRERGRGI